MSGAPGIHAREPDGGWALVYADTGGEPFHLHDIRDIAGFGVRGQDPDGTPLLALSRTDTDMLLLDPPAAPAELVAVVRAIRQHLVTTRQDHVTLRQVFPPPA